MSGRGRTIRNIAIGLGGLVVLILIAGIITVQTDWFRNYVRRTIASSVEDSVGGRVEVGDFRFDPGSLHVTVRNFVIHGNEPANAQPFVSVGRVELYLRLFTSFKRLYELSYLGVDQPAVNISVLPDGRTNIPTPRKKGTSDKSALETVVDLAVGNFALHQGMVTVSSAKQPLDIRGRNLQAQLAYNFATRSYSGQIGMEPLYVVNGRNTPVVFKVALPLTLASDRIDLKNGSISTALSTISLNGFVADMKNPRVSGHINGRISLRDVADSGNLPLDLNDSKLPSDVSIEATADVSDKVIQVSALHVGLGETKIEASGTLRDPKGAAGLDFRADLALAELGRIAKVSARPSGVVSVNGRAKFEAANSYVADGDIGSRNVSFVQGTQRISNVDLASAFHVDPHNVTLSGMRLRALGGEFTGDLALADFERYRVAGQLRNFNIQTLLAMAGQKLPYEGVISGPVSGEGDTKAGANGLNGSAHLAITPGRHGIPVSGRLNATYDGANNNVVVENSYVALPHSRLALSGAVNKRLDVTFTSRDLNDLLAAVPSKTPPQITLDQKAGGQATLNATVTGGLSAPHVQGHLAINQFAVQGRQFQLLQADVDATKAQARIANGLLTRGAMQAQFAGSAGMRNWSVSERSPIAANANLQNGDLADLMALAGRPSEGYSGTLTATAQVNGTVGNPRGNANVQMGSGTAAGEAINRAQLQVNLADQLITVPAAFVEAPAGRVDLTAEFRHPQDSMSTGQVHAHVQSGQLDLSRSATVQKQQPNSGGTLHIAADVNGELRQGDPAFLLTGVNADVNGRALRLQGQVYGDLNASAKTNGRVVAYQLTSDFAGSNISASGNTRLEPDYPTQASAKIANLPIERALTAAKQTGIPARGVLSGSVEFRGTAKHPEGNAQIDVVRANIYNEPIDRAQLRVTYLERSIDVQQLDAVAGPSHIGLVAHYDHPAGDLRHGDARFSISSGHVDLARLQTVQRYRPGLSGAVDVSGAGAMAIQEPPKTTAPANASPQILVSSLNANVSATGISAQGKNFGELKLTANTTAGNRLNFALDSNLAGSTIHSAGNAVLTGDYPVDAQLTFANVTWTRISELLGRTTAGPPAFEATTDGQVTVRGPAMKTDQLNGSLSVTRLNLTTIPRARTARGVTIANQGPIQVALDRGTVRIQNAHLTGPQTDIQASGTAGISGQNLNLVVRANADLGVVQNFDRDAYAAGNLGVNTTIRGTASQPAMNGQITLQNVSLSYVSLPVGLSNANAVIALNGNTAQIRSFTANSGGGRLTLSGFARMAEEIRFGIRASASNMRIRVQQGVSVTADADIRMAGTTDNSRISGDVTVERVVYAPQSDLGSILTRSAPPVQSASEPSPILESMKLDVRVRNSPGIVVESSLTESLQAGIDLHVRGTASTPGILGRVSISEGKVVFFGATYNINTGTIAFYNPVKIEPILDVSLETQAKGVTVTLQVTGPVDNMKLSYTSDPPLQFQEIVALLASGKTPTSDPTVLANQPTEPQQSFQQMGESAILGQAVANPVSSRLQRVFGVTQFKIDPSFTTGSDVPTARLAIQEQITSNLTFSYVSAIDNPNGLSVRVEWAFNPQWSAVATRDQNGIVSLNFFYKRSIR